MPTEELETVWVSDCCHGELVLATRHRATATSPAERDYICRECGRWTTPITMTRVVWDGTLIDNETGERYNEPPAREFDPWE